MSGAFHFLGLLGGRGMVWYDWIFLACAAAVVFPDEILDKLSENTNHCFGRGACMLLAMAGLVAAAGFTAWLMPDHPRVTWWHALVSIGALGVVRAVRWVVKGFLGMDRW